MTKRKEIRYDYRGGTERGVGGSYEWRDGFSQTTSDGGILYPWLTYRECQREAKDQGGKAVFYRDGKPDKA